MNRILTTFEKGYINVLSTVSHSKLFRAVAVVCLMVICPLSSRAIEASMVTGFYQNHTLDTLVTESEDPISEADTLITETEYLIEESDTLVPKPERAVLQADTLSDEPEKEVVHSPTKASMLSATLPGLGQAYNGKYWKIPVIYAGFGVVAYFLETNNQEYQKFRRAWVARVDGNPNTVDELPQWSTDNLERATNFYRRNLEITYIAAAALYILNILDATVDAHLLDFDVSENLGLDIMPSVSPAIPGIQNGGTSFSSLKLTFRF